MRIHGLVLSLLLPVSLAAGCSSDGIDSMDGSGPGKPDDPGGDGTGQTGSAPTLAPAYALVLQTSVTTRDKESGDETTSDAEAITFVSTTQNGAKADFDVTICHFTLPRVSVITPKVDDAVLQSLPHLTVSADVSAADDGSAVVNGQRTAAAVGMQLADPFNDDVPTNQDPTAGGTVVNTPVDVDGDGNPGITVDASLFDVYGAIRLIFTVAGVGAADGTIAGEADATLDVAIYGNSANILGINAAQMAADAQDNSEVVSQATTFQMVPLDAAAADCAGAIALAQSLPAQ